MLSLLRPQSRHFTSTSKRAEDIFNDVFITNTLRTNKSENEFVKCTIYDSKGNMVCHGKNIRKAKFMRDYGLLSRDLRKVIRSHSPGARTAGMKANVEFVPSLVTRDGSILLNLLNIRALIRHDTLVVFDAPTTTFSPSSRFHESHSHGVFLQEMAKRLKADHPDAPKLPYEFRALEAILIDVTANLNTELKVHKTVLSNILASLDDSIERTRLRYLLIQSKKLSQFYQKAKLTGDLLDDLLNQDDELNALYLTEIEQGRPRTSFNHQEVELLLESYYTTIDEIIQTTKNLISQIKTSEEIIKFVLDANRNDLMLLGLRFSIGLLSMGAVLYIAALYGMNLENFIEEIDGGFEGVVIVGSIALVILFFYALKHLKQVQKITMSDLPKKSRIPQKRV
ncbi:uncharacterized protein CXQ87_002441 [Candidozyma duobushaemuli]|uniref:Magnesium transporter n=1 Tax=Candidozyma duobushaemuli TaxID=1231522 RepID=A0A2V1AAM8_9ASCO|nr:uncharacterized protein CXQ87_002441 [[Candida] duobushaemulonis]PVH14313.1 hypothetical protein CXQ87_002441 [[Candida] duobushaemulonis]